MSATFVLTSRYPLSGTGLARFAAEAPDTPHRKLYVDLDGRELLQLRSYDSLAEFAAATAELDDDLARAAPFMSEGDVRRELLRFVEAPKPVNAALPQTRYVQLRHVEVPPARHDAYRRWRDETIFDVVRTSSPVETFLAYHSLVSGQPGVMFIAGFSGSLQAYTDVFSSDRYKDIVKQAGDSYITGGNDGLYTKIYESISGGDVKLTR